MKRSLQFKRPGWALRPTAWVLVGALGAVLPVWAQSGSGSDSGTLTDAERAKRDANKVFSFIKFHAVKPAAAPAAAPAPAKPAPAPAPAPKPVVAARPDTGATVAATSAPAAPASTPLVATAPVSPTAGVPAASAEPAPGASTAFDPRTQPPASEPVAAPAPAPEAPAAHDDDDPGIKLVKYVAPELNQRAMAAMTSNTAKVRVRFTVMPDGSAAKVTAVSNAPRPLALVATRAVEQWRFEGVKEPQEVEVEVDFKLDE